MVSTTLGARDGSVGRSSVARFAVSACSTVVVASASNALSCVAVMRAPCVVRDLGVEVDAGCDLDDEYKRDDPVDTCAERWPPAGVCDEMVSLLPEVLENVRGVAGHE